MTFRFVYLPHTETYDFKSQCTGQSPYQEPRQFETSLSYSYLYSTNSGRVNGRLRLNPNYLYQFKVQSDDPIGVFTSTSTGPEMHCSQTVPFQARSYSRSRGAAGPPPVSDDSTYLATQSKLYSRIANYSVDMSMIVAERQELVNMVSTNTRRLANLYLSLRHGRNPFRGYRRCNSKHAAKLWLEYTYAWTPLVSDVYALAQLKDHDPPPHKVWARTVDHRKIADYVYSGEGGSPNGAPSSVSIIDTYTRRLSTSADAYIKVPVSQLKFAQEIGLTNPALTLWELVPYSFVVDWFLPIGNWLQNQQALYGVVVERASTTRSCRCVVNTTVGYSNSLYAGGTSTAAGNAQGRYIYKTKERSLGIINYPPLRFKSPLSTSHALSGLSLLVSAFHK